MFSIRFVVRLFQKYLTINVSNTTLKHTSWKGFLFFFLTKYENKLEQEQ